MEGREHAPVAVAGRSVRVDAVTPREQVSLRQRNGATVTQRKLAEVRVVPERLCRERARERNEPRLRELPEVPQHAPGASRVGVADHVGLVRDDEIRLELLQQVGALRDGKLRVRHDVEVQRDAKVLLQPRNLMVERNLERGWNHQDGSLRPHHRSREEREQGLPGADSQRPDEATLLLYPVQGEVLDGLEHHGAARHAEPLRVVEVAAGLAACKHRRVVPRWECRDAPCLRHDALGSVGTAGECLLRAHRRYGSDEGNVGRQGDGRGGREHPRHGGYLGRLEPLESGEGIVHGQPSGRRERPRRPSG